MHIAYFIAILIIVNNNITLHLIMFLVKQQ